MKEMVLALIIIIFIVAIGSCSKIADYNLCSKHFPDETMSCFFSSRYKYDGGK